MIEFLVGCTKMVTSEESLALVSRAACDAGADIANVMLTFQLEYMESMGLDRKFGVALMSPTVISKRFPGDEQLGKILHSFMQHCSQAAQIALMTANQRAPADASQRKYAPAATLQRDGEISDATLCAVIDRCVAVFSSPTLPTELLEVMRAQNRSADSILIKWQREFLEGEGLDQDFGVGKLRALPGRAAAAAAARGSGEAPPPAADGGSGGGASDLDRAIGALKRMADTLQQIGAHATIEYQRPTPQELALRRFKPAETLRTSGTLGREDILKFCTEAAKWLLADDSIAKLGALDEQVAGPMSVAWQREYLETMGIEQVRAPGRRGPSGRERASERASERGASPLKGRDTRGRRVLLGAARVLRRRGPPPPRAPPPLAPPCPGTCRPLPLRTTAAASWPPCPSDSKAIARSSSRSRRFRPRACSR
jgi:hypothetical protein